MSKNITASITRSFDRFVQFTEGFIRTSPGLFYTLLGLLLTTSTLMVMAALVFTQHIPTSLVIPTFLALSTLLGLFTFGFVFAYYRDVVAPFLKLRDWARELGSEDQPSTVPKEIPAYLLELADNIKNLTTTVRTLYRDMDELVCYETKHLAQKNRSLEILYELAATIAAAPSTELLMGRVLPSVVELVEAKAATIRLKTKTGQLKLFEQFGFPEPTESQYHLQSIERCLLGQEIPRRGVIHHRNIQESPDCSLFSFADNPMDMISVPLQYGDKTLGVINLYVKRVSGNLKEDVADLLVSIGRHLGIAIVKSNLDNEAHRLSIIQERNLLAHELHDSLAQTLAGLRFQVKLLEQMLMEAPQMPDIDDEVQGVKGGLEEANTELRELLAHFRAPVDERGLLPALKDLIDRFGKKTGIAVYLQQNWENSDLPAKHELQVLRIIQEALSNIRKHSRAKTVRVLLRANENGHYHVLIEDDGVGFDQSNYSSDRGRHIGLSIMQERARHLRGDLHIESDQEEGTRVWLDFDYKAKKP